MDKLLLNDTRQIKAAKRKYPEKRSYLAEKTRVAIYARISTDEQIGNYSIGAQLQICNEYAANNGYSIDKSHVYVDEAFSGGSDERPAFQ